MRKLPNKALLLVRPGRFARFGSHRPTRQRFGVRWPTTAFSSRTNPAHKSKRPLPRSSTPNCLWPGLGTRRGRARHSVRAGVVNQNASVGKRRRAKDCPPYLPQRRPGGRFRRRARPKRQRAGALQDAARGSGGHRSTRQPVLDCGGKRSATPLSPARKPFASRMFLVRPKAPSPLRSAGALPIHPPQTAIDRVLAAGHQPPTVVGRVTPCAPSW